MRKRKWKLSTIIILFVLSVVVVSLFMTDLLISRNTNQQIQNHLEDKAMVISRTVAQSEVVQDGLMTSEIEPAIQDYTQSIRNASDVLFIVVMDRNGIRQSHPNTELIGKPFRGGDEKQSLNGEEYISISEGTLGHSVRAFVPIRSSAGEQLGTVVTGISLDAIDAALLKNHQNILLGSLIGILVGILGAILLARYIKKSLFGLEPVEIARIYEERNRMFHTVREGIVAIDHQGVLTFMNKSAHDLFIKAGLDQDNPIGQPFSSYLPESRLEHVLETGQAELDQEQTINGSTIIVNRIPIVVNEEIVGALSTFRDKTEVNQLAEQLTGVRLYADSLRAQSHEFKNHLHVLLGLVETKAYGELRTYIKQLANHQIRENDVITNKIKDPVLSGFLLGKLSYTREQQLHLVFECETDIPLFKDDLVTHELITIVGNLIDNAAESLIHTEREKLSVTFSYIDDLLAITVEDEGVGIEDTLVDQVFSKGTSTKGEQRGYGLYLVHTSVHSLGGSIEIESTIGRGTIVQVILPIEAR